MIALARENVGMLELTPLRVPLRVGVRAQRLAAVHNGQVKPMKCTVRTHKSTAKESS